MKKVLVTGGAGFLGSHLVDRLIKNNIETVVLDDLSTGLRENVNNDARLIVGSINNNRDLNVAISGCDVVFHLAAFVSVPESFARPDQTIRTNIEGLSNVLMVSVKNNIEHIVFMSSASVYGESKVVPIAEDFPTDPKSPYAISKLSGEYLCYSLADYFDYTVSIVRLFNGYGPRQRMNTSYGAVVPNFVRAVLNNRPIKIYGDGLQTRDFIYVSDVADALIHLAYKRFDGKVNLASGKATSVLELAEIVMTEAGVEVPIEFELPRAGDVKESVGANGLLIKTNFHLQVVFNEGIHRLIESNRNKYYD